MEYERSLRRARFEAELAQPFGPMLHWLHEAASHDRCANLRENGVGDDFLMPVDGVPLWLAELLALAWKTRL